MLIVSRSDHKSFVFQSYRDAIYRRMADRERGEAPIGGRPQLAMAMQADVAKGGDPLQAKQDRRRAVPEANAMPLKDERVLAHAVPGVAGAYDRWSFMEQKVRGAGEIGGRSLLERYPTATRLSAGRSSPT